MQPKDVDKLLKIARRKTDRASKVQDDVLDFIDFYKMKAGRTWVRYSVLYKLYSSWSSKPLTITLFKERMNKYLPFDYSSGCRINLSSINVSKFAYELFKTNHTPVIKFKQVQNFISDTRLEPGPYLVKHTAMFKVFTKWAKKRKLIMLSEEKFYSLMRMYLQFKVTEKGLYFSTNRTPKEILSTLTRKSYRKVEQNGEEETKSQEQG
jgi:hypothetical protein